ncbi:hypothetical protein [Terasakiella pusilla]|uniref:hypothetical protein n=1 Tax=Terasakiella pusilla TaxID=64973 RepID=UPI00068B91AC|nr:hypothetical protein [Terasakiella pusilla]
MWVQIIMMVIQMAVSMKQAADQKKAAQKAAQQQADRQAKAQWDDYERKEKVRKDQLNKAVAQRRARMGAQGLSSADGSAGAIMQGLRTDAAEASHEDFTTRRDSLNQSMSDIQSNLLEQSDAQNRKLYQQAGSSLGGIAGGLIGGDTTSMQMGQQMGGSAGGLMG